MAWELANAEVRLVIDENNVAHIVRSPIPWVLPPIEENGEANDLPSPNIEYRNRHPMITRAGARRVTENTAPSILPVPSQFSASTFAETHESHASISQSTLGEQTEGSVHRNTFNSSPPVMMEPPRHPNNLSSYVPIAPLRQIEDPPTPRIWESRRPSSHYFTIYDDPAPREATSRWLMPDGPRAQDDDQENDYPSDLNSIEEDDAQPFQTFDWNHASVGPRDAFGLPLSLSRIGAFRNEPAGVSWPTRHGRQVLGPLWVDETQSDETWLDENLTDNELHELEQIEAPSQVGPRRRVLPTRHEALHEGGPVRPTTNSRTNVRRVLDFHRNNIRETTPEVDDTDDEDDEDHADGMDVADDADDEDGENEGEQEEL